MSKYYEDDYVFIIEKNSVDEFIQKNKNCVCNFDKEEWCDLCSLMEKIYYKSKNCNEDYKIIIRYKKFFKNTSVRNCSIHNYLRTFEHKENLEIINKE